MLKLTTEQMATASIAVQDGRGRSKQIDGVNVTSSDETVAKFSETRRNGDKVEFDVLAVAAGSCRIVVSADVDLSPAVQDVMGILEVEVELDPRTADRTVTIEAGAPVDQPVV